MIPRTRVGIDRVQRRQVVEAAGEQAESFGQGDRWG